MKKNTKIIIGAVCAALIMAAAGAGLYYKAMEQSAQESQTEGSSTTEAATQAITTHEPVTEETTERETEETTTEEETTAPEPTTGAAASGELPPSADQFIIAEDADQFFENSVFIGDSVMMGFRNYVMSQPEGFFGGPEFLVSGSFSVRMALNTISDTTIHPIYQGKQHYIWDSITMMGAEKVFLFFGLNDIGMEGVDGTRQNYAAVIEKIKEVNPDTEIFVISTTNMLTGSEKGSLNNENIRLLNEQMKAYCETGEADYIDIASFLTGEDGGLRPELCSDEYVHQTYAAYEIWTKVLRGYASGGYYRLETEEPGAETEGGDVEKATETGAQAQGESVAEEGSITETQTGETKKEDVQPGTEAAETEA